MPVILAREDFDAWLGPTEEPSRLLPLLYPFPADQMESFPVELQVNNARNDAPECVQPLAC